MENGDLLDSWKAIAQYLDRNARTCARWRKDLGLPVHSLNTESSRSKVFAYKSEIDEWLRERASDNEIGKKSAWERKWLVTGVVSALVLVSAVLAFLYWQAASRPPNDGVPSIVVLPFQNSSRSEYDEYLSKGITREIISYLSMQKGLKIVSAAALAQYDALGMNLQSISREIKPDYFLKGTLEKTKGKIKLYLEFIRTKDNSAIWNEEFEEPLENFHHIKNEISAKIHEKLGIERDRGLLLTGAGRDSGDFNALDDYLKGNHILASLNENGDDPVKIYYQGNFYSNLGTSDANELAIKLFNRAIEIDEDFALAYIGLANCLSNYANFGWDINAKWLDRALDLLEIAQAISPGQPEYYNSMAMIHLLNHACFDRETKDTAFNLAVEGVARYPNNSSLNSKLAYCYYLKYGEKGHEEDFRKALEYMERSYWMNPYSIGNIFFAELMILNKEFDRALQICLLIKTGTPSYFVDCRIAEINYYKGEFENSLNYFRETRKEFKNTMHNLFHIGMIKAQQGKFEEALEVVDKIDTIFSGGQIFLLSDLKKASIYFGIGETVLGYHHLKLFFSNSGITDDKYIYVKYIDIDRNFENYRDEDPFKGIIKGEKRWLEADRSE